MSCRALLPRLALFQNAQFSSFAKPSQLSLRGLLPPLYNACPPSQPPPLLRSPSNPPSLFPAQISQQLPRQDTSALSSAALPSTNTTFKSLALPSTTYLSFKELALRLYDDQGTSFILVHGTTLQDASFMALNTVTNGPLYVGGVSIAKLRENPPEDAAEGLKTHRDFALSLQYAQYATKTSPTGTPPEHTKPVIVLLTSKCDTLFNDQMHSSYLMPDSPLTILGIYTADTLDPVHLIPNATPLRKHGTTAFSDLWFNVLYYVAALGPVYGMLKLIIAMHDGIDYITKNM